MAITVFNSFWTNNGGLWHKGKSYERLQRKYLEKMDSLLVLVHGICFDWMIKLAVESHKVTVALAVPVARIKV